MTVDIRGFQDLDDIGQRRMMHERAERIKADLAESDIGMAVLARAAHIARIIHMDGRDSLNADDTVKLCQQPIEILDIISGVVHMTGVHADAESFPCGHER